jgi:hypothetical protein
MERSEPDSVKAHKAGPTAYSNRLRSDRRFSSIEFIVVLVLFLGLSPLFQDIRFGEAIESLMLTIVMLSAVVAVGGRRGTIIIAGLLVAPAVVGKWVDHFRPDLMPQGLAVALGIIFVSFVTAHLLIFVIRAPRVNLEVLCAAISAYLMLGVLWAMGYVLTEQLVPGSFDYTAGSLAQHSMRGFQAVYFSMQNLFAATAGDILPLSNVARLLTVTEAAVSLFYLTVLIARLVGAYSARQ